MNRRTLLGAGALAALSPVLPAAAQAPWQPDRPLRIIIT
jgi:tripartite-type tricarboxylate transporter receptor subunit TctC